MGDVPWSAPASFAQERVWLASQVARDVPLYHVLDQFRICALDEQQLREAFAVVISRHETMRTTLRVDDGVLTQEIHANVDAEIEFVDLRALTDESHKKYVEVERIKLAVEPFDLGRPPLWRTRVLRFGDAEWVVLLVAHHTVFDAASVFNLHAEFTEICAAIEAGRPARLPELTIQYADFAVWQRDRLAGSGLDELLAFWRSELAGLPGLHGLRTTRPRPAERGFAGADLLVTIPPEAVATLPEVARRFRTTPFTVLLAAYVALIHRCSATDDVVVGVPVAGRDRPELLPLIGMFVNMVVLRFDVTPGITFGELINRVRAKSLAVWDHQEMPFQKLVETFGAVREPGVPPLYQLGFNHLTTNGFSSTSTTAEDDLLVEVSGDVIRLEYNTGLFDEAAARLLADDYVRVLAAGLADPATALDLLPVFTASPGNALTAPAAGEAAITPTAYVAPRSTAEELMVRVWAEVLGVERVGALDDFFDLGGHSLLALRVIARLSATSGIDLPIHVFFADTTAAGVAAALEALLAAELDDLSEDEAFRLVSEE